MSATIEVALTGTGIPHPTPGRAGPGTLVRYRGGGHRLDLQFDAGRGTVIRLAEIGSPPSRLTAMFLTHVHSDHLVDLADVAMTRWLQRQLHDCGPLPIVCAAGVAQRFAERMFETFDDDIAVRVHHAGSERPEISLRTFDASFDAREVWRHDASGVTVTAVAVHHEPVPEAVAYRVDSPAGSVVISGDTRVCREVEDLSRGADLLVHEACRATAMRDAIAGTVFEKIFSYHADTIALGASAERAGVPHLVLTHLIPSPADETEEQGFVDDVRAGGYGGRVTVGRDLMTFQVSNNV